GIGAEARSEPVGGSIRCGRHQRAVGLWLFFRIRYGLAARINSLRPVGGNERRSQNVLAGGAIEHEKTSVPAGLRKHLAMHSMVFVIKQNTRLHSVPVMRLVRRGLKMPE